MSREKQTGVWGMAWVLRVGRDRAMVHVDEGIEVERLCGHGLDGRRSVHDPGGPVLSACPQSQHSEIRGAAPGPLPGPTLGCRRPAVHHLCVCVCLAPGQECLLVGRFERSAIIDHRYCHLGAVCVKTRYDCGMGSGSGICGIGFGDGFLVVAGTLTVARHCPCNPPPLKHAAHVQMAQRGRLTTCWALVGAQLVLGRAPHGQRHPAGDLRSQGTVGSLGA